MGRTMLFGLSEEQALSTYSKGFKDIFINSDMIYMRNFNALHDYIEKLFESAKYEKKYGNDTCTIYKIPVYQFGNIVKQVFEVLIDNIPFDDTIIDTDYLDDCQHFCHSAMILFRKNPDVEHVYYNFG